jgi:NADPH:quinone reductase-like Zn-dependent oxidoreductase
LLTDIERADREYDVIVESVGGDVFRAAWRRLGNQGLLVWMGQASRHPATLDFFDWAGGTSATMRKFLYTDDSVAIAADLDTLVRLVQLGRLHPEIGSTRPWDETPDVLTQLRARQIRGNAVLVVPG